MRKWRFPLPHSVIHDVEKPFDASGRNRAILIPDTESPCHGRPHCGEVDAFALDGRRRDCILAPGLGGKFEAPLEAKTRQLAFNDALSSARAGHLAADANSVVVHGWPR
ncbi:hypothetical protein PTKU64_44260 [Paraburkholderia terrae]|uniref:Uncharacterized protein n=1 Tax=Paraburkholderia terrae TaxID=311230 RepID=A0ABM7U0F6_9BURK|nr:hypothetical protein PTKU64_44260 [Paraburkholderia terrae]BDC40781.1 hypothetical protein PTKU15_40780 [Paraburkholderia terrae]